MSESKAIVKATSKSLQLNEEDNNLMAQCIALSKSMAVPTEYIGKPDKIFSTVVYGREFGLGPMTSLCNIFNVNGKPSMTVHLMLGLCQRHPDFAGWQIVELEKTTATVEMFRYNERSKKVFRYEASFSIEEAAAAGLSQKDNYRKYPKAMLLARAKSFVMRDAFADILHGVYSLEELAPDKYIEVEEIQKDLDDIKRAEGQTTKREEEEEGRTKQESKTSKVEPKRGNVVAPRKKA